MQLVLATGIFPPDVGGPATYVEHLAKEFIRRGADNITVITYAKEEKGISVSQEGGKTVVRVSKSGGPIVRWRRYAKALRDHAAQSDVVIAFSSISVGMPLKMAKLSKPVRILRLGGDYFWERYTAMGGLRTLREWYKLRPYRQRHVITDEAAYTLTRRLNTHFMKPILPTFHHIVFSTQFQEEIYRLYYPVLPDHSVIENAFPEKVTLSQSVHYMRSEELRGRRLRLLYFGRFVGFKNLKALLEAVAKLPHVTLTFVGEGPQTKMLKAIVQKLGIIERVNFSAPRSQSEKKAVFADHDLLILPSLTEISPNSALEGRANGMPVLLSEETGLSDALTQGMVVRPLRTSEEIAKAVLEVEQRYGEIATEAMQPIPERTWEHVAEEFVHLFEKILPATSPDAKRIEN